MLLLPAVSGSLNRLAFHAPLLLEPPAVRVGQRRVRIRGEDLQTLLDRGQRSGRAAKPAFDAHGFWEGESLPGPQEP